MFNPFKKEKPVKIPTDDPQYPLKDLAELLNDTKTVLRDGVLSIPSWDVTVQAKLEQLDERGAVVYYYLESPQWDRPLFECSAGTGSSQKTAFGMAQGSFVFGFLDGVRSMAEDQPADQVQSEFAGKSHRWSVYRSNVVGMGATPDNQDTSFYWNLLKEGVLSRLGNQKLCYVKLYGAKFNDSITSEVRVNDEISPELSAKLEEYVRTWVNKDFGSVKQLIFLKQQDATWTPYPHSPEALEGHVRTAISLYAKSTDQASYDRYVETLTELVGDQSLAEELHSFLPEFCAENAFQNIDYGEALAIHQASQDQTVYKSQLYSYYPIRRALQKELGGLVTNELYRDYISMSSVYSVICQAKEKGADLNADGGRMMISFGFSEEYELR